MWDTGRVGSTALWERGPWRCCRGRDEDEGHKPGGCQTPMAPWLKAQLGEPSPTSQGSQVSPASRRGQAVLLLCAPSPETPVPAVFLSQALAHLAMEPGTGHHLQGCSLPWETSTDLRQDTADEAVRLLLSQQGLGGGKSSRSWLFPGITRHLVRLPRQKASRSPHCFL